MKRSQFILCLGMVAWILHGCGGSAVLQESASPDIQSVGGSKVVETDATKGIGFSDVVPASLQGAFTTLDVAPSEPFSLSLDGIDFTIEDSMRLVNLTALEFVPRKANAEMISETNSRHTGFSGRFQLIDPQSCGVLSIGDDDFVACPGSLKILIKEGVAMVNEQVVVAKGTTGENFIHDVQALVQKIVEKINDQIQQASEASGGQPPTGKAVQRIVENSVKQVIAEELLGDKKDNTLLARLVTGLIPQFIQVRVRAMSRAQASDPFRIEVVLTKAKTFETILGRLQSLEIETPGGFALSSGGTCSLGDVDSCTITLEQVGASSVEGASVKIQVTSEALGNEVASELFEIPTREQEEAVNAAQQAADQAAPASSPSPTPAGDTSSSANASGAEEQQTSSTSSSVSSSSTQSSASLQPLNLAALLGSGGASLGFSIDSAKTGSDYQAMYDATGQLLAVILDGVTNIGKPFLASLAATGLTSKIGFPVDEQGNPITVEEVQTCVWLPSSASSASVWTPGFSSVAELLGRILFFLPTIGFAQTAAELQEQVNQVLNQLRQLEAQISVLKKSSNGSLFVYDWRTGVTRPISNSQNTVAYDVSCPGRPYFGLLTQQAVQGYIARIGKTLSTGQVPDVGAVDKIESGANGLSVSTVVSTTTLAPPQGSVVNVSAALGVYADATTPFIPAFYDVKVTSRNSFLDLNLVAIGSTSNGGNQVRSRGATVSTSQSTPVIQAGSLTVAETSSAASSSLMTDVVRDVRLGIFEFQAVGNDQVIISKIPWVGMTDNYNFNDNVRFYTAQDATATPEGDAMTTTGNNLTISIGDMFDVPAGYSKTVQVVLDVGGVDPSPNTIIFAIPQSNTSSTDQTNYNTISVSNSNIFLTPSATPKTVVSSSEVELGRWTLTASSDQVKVPKLLLINGVSGATVNSVEGASYDITVRDSTGNILGQYVGESTGASSPAANQFEVTLPTPIVVPKNQPVTLEIQADMLGANITSGSGPSQSTFTQAFRSIAAGAVTANVSNAATEETLALTDSGYKSSFVTAMVDGTPVTTPVTYGSNDDLVVKSTASSSNNTARVSMKKFSAMIGSVTAVPMMNYVFAANVGVADYRIGSYILTAQSASTLTTPLLPVVQAVAQDPDLPHNVPGGIYIELLPGSKIKVTAAPIATAADMTVSSAGLNSLYKIAMGGSMFGSSSDAIQFSNIAVESQLNNTATYTAKATCPIAKQSNGQCIVGNKPSSGGNPYVNGYNGSITFTFQNPVTIRTSHAASGVNDVQTLPNQTQGLTYELLPQSGYWGVDVAPPPSP